MIDTDTENTITGFRSSKGSSEVSAEMGRTNQWRHTHDTEDSVPQGFHANNT